MPSNTLPLFLLPLHPVTGRRALGFRRPRATRGEVGPQPIWPIAGGDGTGDGGDGGDGKPGGDGGDGGSGDGKDGGQGDGRTGDQDGKKGDGGDQGKGDDDKLGEGGKKALESERAARAAAEKKAAELEAENARLRRSNASTKGHDLDAIRKEILAKIGAENGARLIRAEVRAAAAGVLRDPADALQLLDLDAIKLTADGDVDSAAVKAAVEQLVKDKPYLAADAGKPQGWGDIGAGRTAGGDAGDDVRPGADRIRAAYESGSKSK